MLKRLLIALSITLSLVGVNWALTSITAYKTFTREVLTSSDLNQSFSRLVGGINSLIALHPGDSTVTVLGSHDTLTTRVTGKIVFNDPLVSKSSADSVLLHLANIQRINADSLYIAGQPIAGFSFGVTAGQRARIAYLSADTLLPGIMAGALDANNQAITNVDINSGAIDGATIATSDITVGSGKTLDVSAGTLTLADDQILGDKISGGTIGTVTISQLAGALDANSQAITNVDINSGSIDGATIATSDITVGSGKTLDVSAGTLTLADDQIGLDALNGLTSTAAELNKLDGYTGTAANLTSLIDDSMTDSFHRHSELSASDGTPAGAITVDAAGNFYTGDAWVSQLTLDGGLNSTAGDISFDGGSFVFNQSGADKDFRIEGDAEANLFIADASGDAVTMGTATQSGDARLTVQGEDAIDHDGVYSTQNGALGYCYVANNDRNDVTLDGGVFRALRYGTPVGGLADTGVDGYFGIYGITDAAILTGAETVRLYADDDTGHIGIGTGTAAPPSQLSLYRNDTSTANSIAVQNAGGGDASIRFEYVTLQAWALGLDGTDNTFKISETGDFSSNNHFVIDTSGRVGIGGVTDPDHLIEINNSDGASMLKLERTSGNTGTASFNIGGGDPGFNLIVDGTAGDFTVTTGGAERIRIDDSGKVGIGTAAPYSLLELSQNTATALVPTNVVTGTKEFVIRNTAAGAGVYGAVSFNNTGNSQNRLASIYGVSESASNTGMALGFATRDPAGGNVAERMRIDSNGNVGIGTAAPDGTGPNLHIQTSEISGLTADGDADNLIVEQNGRAGISILSADDEGGKLIFGSASDATGAAISWYHGSDELYVGTTHASAELSLRIGENVEAVRIDASGNVGIGYDGGAEVPDGKLHVWTGSAGSVTAHANGDNLVIEDSSTNTGMTFLSPDNSVQYIYFGEASEHKRGNITYNHSTDRFSVATAGSDNLIIDSSGNVGIGSDSGLDHKFEIISGGTYSEIDPGESTFTVSSHSSFKENFESIDEAAVVKAFMEMPGPRKYNFKRSMFEDPSWVASREKELTDESMLPEINKQIADLKFARRDSSWKITPLDSLMILNPADSIEVITPLDSLMVVSPLDSLIRITTEGDTILTAQWDTTMIAQWDTTIAAQWDTTMIAQWDSVMVYQDPKEVIIPDADSLEVATPIKIKRQAAYDAAMLDYNNRLDKASSQSKFGLMAEDFHVIAKMFKSDSDPNSLDIGQVVNALVIVVQDQNARIEALEEKVSALERK